LHEIDSAAAERHGGTFNENPYIATPVRADSSQAWFRQRVGSMRKQLRSQESRNELLMQLIPKTVIRRPAFFGYSSFGLPIIQHEHPTHERELNSRLKQIGRREGPFEYENR
jgi:hypothetical protein